MKNYYESNQAFWDDKVAYHKKSDFYRLDDFKKGWNSLKKVELEGVGDVSGKSLLHLQCHFGQDTLSWARMGADVTGVDFSSEAIKLARELNDELGLNAQFVESNILELDGKLDQQYDIIFTSYGTICWLGDLEKWAEIVQKHLKPGGFFFIADFHPTLYMYDWETGEIAFPYFFNEEPSFEVIEGTYADNDAPIGGTEYFWFHPISKTINLLTKQGLTLETFNEFPYSPYDCFPNMDKKAEDVFVYKLTKFPLPHVYSLKMRKP